MVREGEVAGTCTRLSNHRVGSIGEYLPADFRPRCYTVVAGEPDVETQRLRLT
jgi:hypothetical protein